MIENKPPQKSVDTDTKAHIKGDKNRQFYTKIFHGIRRNASKITSALCAGVILCCFSGNTAMSVPYEPFALASRNAQTKPVYSSNWAGEIVSSDIRHPKPQVSSIEGSWRVPYMKSACGADSSEQNIMLQWIGIGFGGYFKRGKVNDKTLIQVGTDLDIENNTKQYTAWYELLPNQSEKQQIKDFKIMPGDTISAKIYLSDQKTNKWTIYLKNMSENERPFINTFYFNSSQLSGEWIVERESSGFNSFLSITYYQLPRADSVSFTSINDDIGNYVTIGKTKGSIYGFSRVSVDMVDSGQKNNDLMSPIVGSKNNIKFRTSQIGSCNAH